MSEGKIMLLLPAAAGAGQRADVATAMHWHLPALAPPCYNNVQYTEVACGGAKVCRQAAPAREPPPDRLK